MLRNIDHTLGYHLQATDDHIGRCQDFMFDDRDWVVRYIVVNTHRWLPGGSNVLISPIAVDAVRDRDNDVVVKLSTDQIKNGPLLEDHRPISREYELRLFRHYGYGFYWMGPGLWGTYPHPGALVDNDAIDELEKREGVLEEKQYHLRSWSEISGYGVSALDNNCGHVEDLLVDDRSWQIQYLVVNPRNWLPGATRLVIPRAAVTNIDWSRQQVSVALTQSDMKNAVEYEPGQLGNANYEAMLAHNSILADAII